MTVLIVGAGATGGYFGAKLAQAHRDVTFLVRPRRAEQLRERGLRIVGQGADQVVIPQLVTADQLAGHADIVLVTVKATALEAAVGDFAPAVGPRTLVIPFLNGMSHLATLNARFGEQAVLGGVVLVATQLSDEGDVVELAPSASLQIGAQDGSRTDRVQAAYDELSVAGFDLSISDDIVAEMWHKWVFIATVGALTCLMRGTVGDIVAVPGGRGLGPAILAEASAVSAAAGYPVPGPKTAATAQAITREGSPLTSSMSRDLADGRPVEVEPVLADLASRGSAFGVPTPLLDLATMHLRVYNHRLGGHSMNPSPAPATG
jgi:2-dehydropantoate 2-reductase